MLPPPRPPQPNAFEHLPSRRWVDPAASEGERTTAMWMHLLFLLVVPTLILWLSKKDESPFLEDHGREALNFQLSMVVYLVAGTIVTCGAGFPIFIILAVIGGAIASGAAKRGEYFRYPANLRLIQS